MIVFLLIVSTLSSCLSLQLKTKINPKGPTVTHHAVSCLLSVADQYFVKTPGLVVMTKSFNMTAPGADIERLFMEEIQVLLRWSVMVVGKDDNENKRHEYDDEFDVENNATIGATNAMYAFADRADYYVIIVDSITMFKMKMKELSVLASWNPRARVVVLCAHKMTSKHSLTIYSHEILSTLWTDFVLYGVVFLPDPIVRTTFRAFSWNPYDPSRSCGKSADTNETLVELYDICREGHMQTGRDLYKNKLYTDLKGCVIRVLAVEKRPFINSDEDDHPGIETEILDTIAKKFKFLLKYDKNSTTRGDDGPGGEWSGMMGRLKSKEAELGVGAIYPDNMVHDQFDATTSYLQDSYTWVVPRALRLPRWRALIIIFEKKLWLSVMFVYVICVFVWYILGNLSGESLYHKSLSHCSINSLCLNIGGVAYSCPVEHTLRVFFIFFSLYGVILITAYQTKLITILTQDSYAKEMDSLKELLDSGLNFGGFEELKGLFEDSDENLYAEVEKRYMDIDNTDEALHYVIVNRNFSLLASRMFLTDIISEKTEYSDRLGVATFSTFTDNVFSIPMEIVSSKGFPYIELFSKQIHLMISNGLMSKWQEDFVVRSKRKTAAARRASLVNEDENDLTRLSLEQLEGGFLILAIGYLLGTAAFLAEFFVKSVFFLKIFKAVQEFHEKTNLFFRDVFLRKS